MVSKFGIRGWVFPKLHVDFMIFWFRKMSFIRHWKKCYNLSWWRYWADSALSRSLTEKERIGEQHRYSFSLLVRSKLFAPYLKSCEIIWLPLKFRYQLTDWPNAKSLHILIKKSDFSNRIWNLSVNDNIDGYCMRFPDFCNQFMFQRQKFSLTDVRLLWSLLPKINKISLIL